MAAPRGAFLVVRAPVAYHPAIVVRVTVAAGYLANATAVRVAVKNALLVYINGLGIGEDIIVAQLYEVAMAVPGVADFLVVTPTPSDPQQNIAVADNQLARLTSADLTVQ